MIFEPSEKLSRMLAWRDAIHTYYTNTLCELFKTKQFLKCQKLAARLEGHAFGNSGSGSPGAMTFAKWSTTRSVASS